MTKVSVIIPTYNQSQLVLEAIESVLCQTHSDLEVLVVDDGSTDDTAKVVKKIKDNRIKYFYKENGGGASARNFALDRVNGHYIAFLDHDDLWRKNHLEIMLKALNHQEKYGMAYSQYEDHFLNGDIVEGVDKTRHFSGPMTRYFFGKMPCILPSTTFYRRDILSEFYHDESADEAGDIDFFLRLSARTHFLFVPESTVIRRRTAGSMTHCLDKSFSHILIRILERFYFVFGGDKIVPAWIAKKKFGRLYRGAARKHLQMGHRQAAINLSRKAIGYSPLNPKYYKDFVKALLLRRKSGVLSDWQMHEPLPPYIAALGKKIQYSV